MIIKRLLVTVLAVTTTAAWIAQPTQAATLKNLDKAAHKIVVVEGDSRQEIMIQSLQELDGFCSTSCSLYVGNDPEPYEVAASDKMEINNGEVFYQEVPTEPPSNQ